LRINPDRFANDENYFNGNANNSNPVAAPVGLAGAGLLGLAYKGFGTFMAIYEADVALYSLEDSGQWICVPN